MSVKPNKKPSFALGLILILLLLAAVILGGSWVVRQAFLPRQSDARPAAAAVSGAAFPGRTLRRSCRSRPRKRPSPARSRRRSRNLRPSRSRSPRASR